MRTESRFQANAKSPVGARGLMQLMPATAKMMSRKVKTRQLYNPKLNIRLGIKYFDRLMKKYEDNLAFTLMAYNAGEGNLRKWKNRIFKDHELLNVIESVPFQETRKYVKLIFRNLFFYKYLLNKDPDTEQRFSKLFLKQSFAKKN